MIKERNRSSNQTYKILVAYNLMCLMRLFLLYVSFRNKAHRYEYVYSMPLMSACLMYRYIRVKSYCVPFEFPLSTNSHAYLFLSPATIGNATSGPCKCGYSSDAFHALACSIVGNESTKQKSYSSLGFSFSSSNSTTLFSKL